MEVSRAVVHVEYLRALARKLCRTRFDAEDLVQDVFVKALRTPMPPNANERAWLARVMRNQFIDQLRRRATRREEVLVDRPAETDDEAWWQTLSFDDVRAMLAQLPEEQRVTFELFVIDGKSYDEIAAQLAIARNTVGTRVLRARQKLRSLLADRTGGVVLTSPRGAGRVVDVTRRDTRGARRDGALRLARAFG